MQVQVQQAGSSMGVLGLFGGHAPGLSSQITLLDPGAAGAPTLVGTLVLAPDITAQRDARQQIKEQRKLYRQQRLRRRRYPRGQVMLCFRAPPTTRVSTAPMTAAARKANPTYGLLSGGGIDLALRGHEVRKILYKCFGHKMAAGGHDPELVLSEVYKGLLVRNNGKCPWDPAKSSFGHYVYMVCSGVLVNYHQRQRRLQSREQVGLRVVVDGSLRMVNVGDAETSAVSDKKTDLGAIRRTLSDCVTWVAERSGYTPAVVGQVLDLLAAGHKRTAVARQLGVGQALCNKVWYTSREFLEGGAECGQSGLA